ncbi:MAG: transglycosylase SLT domain-containing protein [Pseudomonadales bacterium]|nr:transglycosylase SLT domain-containing protein [Pseudomonadales bacterium]MDP7594445.1 transglycosylase SLT domain-containing protein [Pseudomonadales bacterium]HJN49139.1 transglycosylase SLT domain-containing protein [Pseudomonadales bacterium]
MKQDKTLCMVFLLSSLTLFGSSPGRAEEAASRYEQRVQYRQAMGLLQSGQRTRFLKLAAKLEDYPLSVYLTYADLARRISRQSSQQIDAFRKQYPDTPLADRLLQTWLYSLARRGRWQKFMDHYQDEVSTTRLDCHRLLALYKTGQEQLALELTSNHWLVDHSQPDACDPIFKLWRDAGYLTQQLAWQRLSMSIQANQTSLASWLANFLGRENKNLAQLYRQVKRRPATVQQHARFAADSEKVKQIVIYGVRQLARRDATAALKVWQKYLESHSFMPQQITDTYLFLAVRLTVQRDPDDLIDSIPLDLSEHNDLLERRIRMSLYRQDWRSVLVFINALPPELQITPRWQFWRARMLAKSTDPEDRSSAGEIYRRLAATRGYYGFLAADILEHPYAMENTPTRLDRDEVERMASVPGIERAVELFILGERTRARSEWRFASRDFSAQQLMATAKVAQNWGWYEQSIQTVINAERWDDLQVRFPLAFFDTFIANARNADIPVNWSLAVARQESAFMPDAKSSAGALGVMQLMPNTAKIAAARMGIAYRSKSQLIEPDKNISLGTAYLGQMLRRFDNNRILATAAYNAGPARVDSWLKDDFPSYDVWIETIPFSETRRYVQNVLQFSVIFSYRLEQPQTMILHHEKEFFDLNRDSQAMAVDSGK